MNILFLNPVGTLGGAERVLLAMIRALRTNPEHRLSLITLSDGPLLEEAKRLGVTTNVVPLPKRLSQMGDSQLRSASRLQRLSQTVPKLLGVLPKLWSHSRRFRQIMVRQQPDLVHSNGIKTHLLLGLIRTGKLPIVWHIHDFYGSRPMAGRLLRQVAAKVSLGIAISKAVQVDVGRTIPKLATEVIWNTVDVDRFCPGTGNPVLLDELAGMEPASSQTLRVGLVATYARWKGQDIFLQAAKQVLQSSPRLLRFYIIGGPVYQTAAQFTLQELQAMADSFGIRKQVGFIPFQKETAQIYRALDVMVHASIHPEPFGLTIAEAMSCGRAVIVSQAGGAAELFTHAQDAYGIPPANPTRLAEAIQNLAGNADLRHRLGQQARQTALRQFHPNRLTKQLEEVYQRINYKKI